MTIEAMKLALEALEWSKPHEDSVITHTEAIAALKERLLEAPMREVQRLGQEIEQEPVAQEPEPDVVMHCDSHTWTTNTPPPKGSGDVNLYYAAQRKPLTDEQRQELMSKAWNEWLSRKDDGRLFAWSFSFEVEAAHGIKEKNT